jgi:probable rRNA maturation factor
MAGEVKPWQKLGLSKAGLARFVNRARAAVGVAGEVHVLLTGDATLRRLNRSFRGKNKATDVLSFPAGDAGDGNGVGVAGDLAISLETAARQAAQFGHSLRDEVRVLLLHGVLHLAGFDHEADAGEMAAREAEMRRELGLETSLIARVSGRREKRVKSAGRKVRDVGVVRAASGSFDCGAHDKAVSASAQDDSFKRSARDDEQKTFARDDGCVGLAGKRIGVRA